MVFIIIIIRIFSFCFFFLGERLWYNAVLMLLNGFPGVNRERGFEETLPTKIEINSAYQQKKKKICQNVVRSRREKRFAAVCGAGGLTAADCRASRGLSRAENMIRRSQRGQELNRRLRLCHPPHSTGPSLADRAKYYELSTCS